MKTYYNFAPEHNYAMNHKGFRNFILLLILILIVSLILIFKHHGRVINDPLDEVHPVNYIACSNSVYSDSLHEQKAGS